MVNFKLFILITCFIFLFVCLMDKHYEHKYISCRKKNKYVKNCNNFSCLIAHICPYSQYFDDLGDTDD